MFDLESRSGRMAAIDYIESNENRGRKTTSYEASEIYNDRIKQYVVEELREQFSEHTVREMPVVSSVNICKRIVNQLACIYSDAPMRDFTELSEEQIEVMNKVYDDMMANKKLNLANKLFKNHDQCLLQILPKNGKLIMRAIKPHQYVAIPDDNDVESFEAIIISGYNNYYELKESADEPVPATGRETNHAQMAENYKEARALDAMEIKNKVYTVYTKEFMYRMNEEGEILGEVMDNPLRDFDMLPFVEISAEKEFEYWVRTDYPFAKFTREFNAAMSSVQQVVKMQGFAVGVLKGPQGLLMESITVGPNIILKLPVDPNAGIDTDFNYVNPGSDINGSIAYLEVLLTTFLSSNGIDPKTVTMSGEGQTYNSGIERLLSMIEKVSASREDFDTFEKVEQRVHKLICAWLTVLDNSENLDDKYKIGNIPEDCEVKVDFARPELVKSEAEELEIVERQIALGVSSPIKAIMDSEGLSREQAEERFDQYQQDMMRMPPMEQAPNGDQG